MKKFEEVYSNLDSVTMIITNKCNLACHYCFEKDKGSSDMTVEMALDIFKKSYNPGASNITYNLFGGEPMVNWPVIKAICDYKNENRLYNVRFGITSNMTILTDEMIEYIDDNDIFILASVDGIKEVHDLHRVDHADNGSFDRVISNIKRLIDSGLSHLIEARMTITPENVSKLTDGVKMLLDLGINNICPIPASDLEWSKESLEEYKKQFTQVLELYCDILNDTDNSRNINIKYIDDILGNVLEPDETDTAMCHIGNNRWACIDWNGDVYPCHNFPTTNLEELKEMVIGNIYTGIDETRVKEKATYAKFELDRCNGCNAKLICKSGCPFQNYVENGDFFEPTLAYCELQRVIIGETLKFREKLLGAENIRSRRLNILIENLKLKEYFDKEVSETDIMDRSFQLKLDRFVELYQNLEFKNNIIPSFNRYLTRRMAIFMAALSGLNGNEIYLEEENAK